MCSRNRPFRSQASGTLSYPRGAPHRGPRPLLFYDGCRGPTPPSPRRRYASGPSQQALHLPAALRCLRGFVTGAPLQIFLFAPVEAAVQTDFIRCSGSQFRCGGSNPPAIFPRTRRGAGGTQGPLWIIFSQGEGSHRSV
ncbi:hypothetical protein NDU88_004332 [Pleurodeles waltl]|uniref:Uncharacterized protein n=1 Tax=Pleurodeles waltl TaxID=8319 RepID=A0AAV7WUB5_PLEWA|nr:hypothetical protein NDU88_004332 [Pleurodeles waltl]